MQIAELENNGPSSTTGKTTGSGEKAVFSVLLFDPSFAISALSIATCFWVLITKERLRVPAFHPQFPLWLRPYRNSLWLIMLLEDVFCNCFCLTFTKY